MQYNNIILQAVRNWLGPAVQLHSSTRRSPSSSRRRPAARVTFLGALHYYEYHVVLFYYVVHSRKCTPTSLHSYNIMFMCCVCARLAFNYIIITYTHVVPVVNEILVYTYEVGRICTVTSRKFRFLEYSCVTAARRWSDVCRSVRAHNITTMMIILYYKQEVIGRIYRSHAVQHSRNNIYLGGDRRSILLRFYYGTYRDSRDTARCRRDVQTLLGGQRLQVQWAVRLNNNQKHSCRLRLQ